MTRSRRERRQRTPVKFMVQDEKGRCCLLNSMVSCLFARGVYSDEVLGSCLKSLGYGTLADRMDTVAAEVQKLNGRCVSGQDTGLKM